MKYTKEDIVKMLETSNYAVERAILAIYARQTADEQATERTHNHNSMGFTAFDAEIFSSFAKRIETSRYPNGQRLSPGQLGVCRKLDKNGNMKIAKYARQLLEIANAKEVSA